MDQQERHWDEVYGARAPEALTWFEEVPEISLGLIRRYAVPAGPVVDVGGGASRLPDALLADGFGDICVLDLSAAALDISKSRLGPAASRVRWVVGDVTRWTPDKPYGVWHDRAVFHFLTSPADQDNYIGVMRRALAPGGHAIIATFAEDGPERCSNLPVVRYSPEALAARLEAGAPGVFAPVEAQRHVHATPMGRTQAFQVSVFRRSDAP
ncbi:methyltransferase domain-containing protein [Rhodobacterales bacterium HKCCSP123]|nr:methyltransferase domain-containing protein [Rhodobacterales bacterium HKCCSP123]